MSVTMSNEGVAGPWLGMVSPGPGRCRLGRLERKELGWGTAAGADFGEGGAGSAQGVGSRGCLGREGEGRHATTFLPEVAQPANHFEPPSLTFLLQTHPRSRSSSRLLLQLCKDLSLIRSVAAATTPITPTLHSSQHSSRLTLLLGDILILSAVELHPRVDSSFFYLNILRISLKIV